MYDIFEMVRIKMDFVRQCGLGGVMWWESSVDKDGFGSLIIIVVDIFGGMGSFLQKENCIEYLEIKYDNLRNGFLDN